MKAPKKIYLHQTAKGEVGANWLTFPLTDEDAEYIRADISIERALKWYCLDCACNDNCKYKCAFWSFFKDYLKGNDKALPPKSENAINPDGSTTDNYRYRHFIKRMQDTFVKKAISWLKEQNEMIGVSFREDFLERFQNYMKGK